MIFQSIKEPINKTFIIIKFLLFLLLISFSITFKAVADNSTNSDIPQVPSVNEDINFAIVSLDAPSAASYQGGIGDYNATKPPRGKHLQINDNNVQRYVAYLKSKHAQLGLLTGNHLQISMRLPRPLRGLAMTVN